MSTDSSAGVLSGPEGDSAGGGSQGRLPSPILLGCCDRALGEIGRRQHRFGWLRSPDPAAGEWLAIDAYYPGRHVVVVCRELSPAEESLVSELVPAHGLALLRLVASDLGADREAAAQRIEAMIAELRLPERRAPAAQAPPRGAPRLEGALSRMATAFSYAATPARPEPPVRPSRREAVQRATRYIAASGGGARAARRTPAARPVTARASAVARASAARAVPGRTPPARPVRRVRGRAEDQPAPEPLALALALTLSSIVAVELYVGVMPLAVGGHWWLALGLAFDVCSRVLGTIAARRAGPAPPWDWACAAGGAPVVAAFTLFGRDGPVAAHPAPLAGVLSVLAMALLVLAGAAALLS